MYQLGAISFRFSMMQMGKKGMCNNESPKKILEIAKPTRFRVGFGKGRSFEAAIGQKWSQIE